MWKCSISQRHLPMHSWHVAHTTYTSDIEPSIHLRLTARLLNEHAEGVTLSLTALASCQFLILHDRAWVSIAMATGTPLLPREQLAHGGRLALKQIYWQKEWKRESGLLNWGQEANICIYKWQLLLVRLSLKRSYSTKVIGIHEINSIGEQKLRYYKLQDRGFSL